MQEKKELLIRTAAKLYSIGMDLDYAKEQLRKLVNEGVSFDSSRMLNAYNEYKELEEQWNFLEAEYLDMKDDLYYKKELA
jgi:hypothetical protein